MIVWLSTVTTLAFVMAVTPGPNNILFAASGARVGYLRTLPGLLGMLVGFATIILASAAGIGAVIAGNERLQIVLTVGASAYMAWLAIRLWRSSGTANANGDSSPVMTWWQFAAFQFANPKTWLASIAFVSGFLGANAPGGYGMDAVGIVWFLTVVALSANVWVLFGATLRARMTTKHWSHLNKVLAALAAGTIVTFWI